MLINLAHLEITRDLLGEILMDAISLVRSMRSCKEMNETIKEKRKTINASIPHNLFFDISAKPGTYGTRAETSIINFSLEYESWNKELQRLEKIRLEFCKNRNLLFFLEKRLPEFSIFHYNLLMFKFETESVMLRVLATLKMLNFRCDEIFYPICPSFPLIINTLRPIKIQACCQPTVDWIDVSYNKNFLSYTFERFCIFDSSFELFGLMNDIIERTTRVELMSCHFRPQIYRFILLLMKKMINEDHDTIEFWATLAKAPMPTKRELEILGSYLLTQSQNERMILVLADTKIVCLNIMKAPVNDTINLILRRYNSLEEYKIYYGQISLDPNRYVMNKMMNKITARINQSLSKLCIQ